MRNALYFILLLSSLVQATTFKPVEIDEQVLEADGIIQGYYLRSRSVEIEDGKIATQMIFKITKEWGMQSDLFGMDEIIVHFPGGEINGAKTVVHGVPSFIPGEKVVLLTKSVDNRYWGLNLGLGSFKIVSYGNETLLMNSLFPSDTKISQLRLHDFEMKIRQLKGSSLKVVFTEGASEAQIDRSPASKEGKKRAIASYEEEEDNKEEQSGPSVFWLVTLLALSGVLGQILRRKGA